MKPGRLFVALLCAAVLLTGCDSASPLSADLVDTSSGSPEIVQLSPGPLTPSTAPDVTGNARRSLVGTVTDPLAGTLSAAAGLDFSSPVALSSDFRNGPVTEAELRLLRTYLYGDTTSTLQIAVRSIDEEWAAAGATSNGDIPFGDVIVTDEIAVADTLTTISLPSSWIEANSDLIRSTDFLTGFHGFYLDPTGGNAIVGLSSQASFLRVVSGEDTVNFIVNSNQTLVNRENTGTPPPGTTLLQDGIGEGLEVDFNLAVDSLEGTALNRVVLQIPIDTTSATLPANFARPRPTQIDFAGVTEDSVVVTLAVSSQAGDALRFDTFTMTQVMQDVLLAKSPFVRFVIRGHLGAAPFDNTIDVLLIPDGSTGGASPSIVFTVVKP